MAAGYLIAFGLLILFRLSLVRSPRWLRNYLDAGPWGDSLAYFIQIQHYRTRSGNEPDPRCLFRGRTLDTPSCYHKLLRQAFSDALLWAKPWVPNLVIYAAGVVVFLGLSAVALGHASLATIGLLVVVFLAQADSSRFDTQSVHYVTIQPRLLGALALSTHALVFAIEPSPALAIAFGTLALAIAINTSVFSRQVAYFALPLTALIAANPIPLVNLGCATALSLILNRREFLASSGAHWRYAKWYFRNFYATREGAGLWYWVRRTFAPPVRFLPRYADSMLALALLTMILDKDADGFARRAAAVIAGALIVCAVTALRRFASLGECWRYLSFSCYFLTPLALVYAVLKLGIPLAGAYAVALAVLAWHVHASARGSGNLSNPNREILQLLRSAFPSNLQPSVWWSAHYRYGSIPVALGWGQSSFEIQGTDMSEDVMARLFVRYPYLRCSEAFFDEHHVTHMLISKSEWPVEHYGPIADLVRAHRVLAESAAFIILERVRA